MNTIQLIEHLANIFLDIVLPALVLWIGYSVRGWLPKEVESHAQISQITTALFKVFHDAEQHHAKTIDYPPSGGKP